EFKKNKSQIVSVADEHGGFAGIVTMEDLMEEIVGELYDEHDVEERTFEVLNPRVVRVSGKYYIEDLNERLGLNIPDDEFNTVGGYVFGILGREPENGDTIQFEDLTFTVIDCDGPRIKTIELQSLVDFEQASDEAS